MLAITQNIIQLFKRLSIAMLVFSVVRVMFYWVHQNHFPELNPSVFWYGLRFDIVAVTYLFIPFIILSVMPLKSYHYKWRDRVLLILFHIGNTTGLVFNFIDVIYYNFTFKRSTADLFSLVGTGNDVSRLIPTFMKDYWYMFLVLFVLVYITHKLYKKTGKGVIDQSTGILNWVKKGVAFILILAVGVIGARGGTQLKPLSIPDGGKYTEAQNIPVLFNTPFSILLSFELDALADRKYFSDEEAEQLYSPIQTIQGNGEFKGKNVVLIILESFASEYVGYLNEGKGFTPFLDSLLSESYVFKNNRSNGLKSIEALPALLAGIPALDNTSYILSNHSSNHLYALPHRLKELGYGTSFYHGGSNGTMGFDAFCGLAGMDSYYGLNEYPNSDQDYDGNWGVFDEPYLSYFADELKEKTQPFFGGVFTLSSHHPYSIPEHLKNRFPKGDLAVHETIGYTDYALQQFFKKIEKEEWFQNTLFVITADHPAQTKSPYYIRINGKFKVPLAFYSASGGLKGSSMKIAKHADVSSTILGLLGDTTELLNFGEDLFQDTPGFMVNLKSNGFHFRSEGLVVLYNGEEVTKVFLESDSLANKNLIQKLEFQEAIERIEKKGKAYLQQYSQRILENRLTISKP